MASDESFPSCKVPPPSAARAELNISLLDSKKKASEIPDAALANALVKDLEREIHARADHPKVVLRTINKIPAEITDPPDVRR
jgi:hypothetical protein